jgi:hypothetical protein
MTGRTIGDSMVAQMKLVHSRVLNGDRSLPEGQRTRPPQQSVYPPQHVVLDEELPEAEHSFKPSKAKATFLDWSHADQEYRERSLPGGLEDETFQVDVFNHRETKSYEEDTFGMVFWIDGHWCFAGDCDPMADREPPVEEA